MLSAPQPRRSDNSDRSATEFRSFATSVRSARSWFSAPLRRCNSLCSGPSGARKTRPLFTERLRSRSGPSPLPPRTRGPHRPHARGTGGRVCPNNPLVRMILPQVHLRKPCYDVAFLSVIRFTKVFRLRRSLPSTAAVRIVHRLDRWQARSPSRRSAKLSAASFDAIGQVA